MRTRLRSTSVLAVVLLLLAGSLLPAAAAGGNVSEEDLDGYDWCAKFELNGSYVFEGGADYVTITSGDATGGTFTSTQPVSVVFVKGGSDNDGGTLYDPAVLSGSFSNVGLPLVGDGNEPGISNITFCGDVPPPASVSIEAAKAWYQTSTEGLVELDAAPVGAAPSYEVVVKGPGAEIVVVEALDAGDTLMLPGLVDGESYLLTWEEIDPLGEFDLDGATCTWQEESAYVGSETFVAGEVDTVSFTGVNIYECQEVLGSVLPPPTTTPTTTTPIPMPATLATTGVPALLLALLGLLSVGIGGGLLSRRRR